MSDERPDVLYRGTTLSRVEERWSDNSDFPGNWTDDPLQGASYALGYSLGDSHNNVPVVLITDYDDDSFSEGGNGVPTYFPDFSVEESRSPDWYRHTSDDRFESEAERDEALEMFDVNTLEAFIDDHLTDASEGQKDEVRKFFDQLTYFDRYRELHQQDN